MIYSYLVISPRGKVNPLHSQLGPILTPFPPIFLACRSIYAEAHKTFFEKTSHINDCLYTHNKEMCKRDLFAIFRFRELHPTLYLPKIQNKKHATRLNLQTHRLWRFD